MKPEIHVLPNKPDTKFYDVPGVMQVNPEDATKGPGAGVVYTFSEDTDVLASFIIAYHRNNPAAGQSRQLAISIGGGLDIKNTLADNLNHSVKLKTQGVDAPELKLTQADLAAKTAAIYNMRADESQWPMSFVYVQHSVKKSLDELKELVSQINEKMAVARTTMPFLNDYGIYRVEDIVKLINVTCEQDEKDKVPAQLLNYATNTMESAIVFDDYATQPLLNAIITQQQHHRDESNNQETETHRPSFGM